MNFLQESVLRRYFAFLLLFLALLTGFGILYGTNCIQAEKICCLRMTAHLSHPS